MPFAPPPPSAAGNCYVLDTHGLIFQMFHGIGPISAPDGRPTNAVFGVTRADRADEAGGPPTSSCPRCRTPGPPAAHGERAAPSTGSSRRLGNPRKKLEP